MAMSTHKPVVVIPNLNGGDDLMHAVSSLATQTIPCHIVVVDNASTDGSADNVLARFSQVEVIRHTRNRGYAGGVNPGLRIAVERKHRYVAVFNDDAVADPEWLATLVSTLDTHPEYAAASPKTLKADKKTIDSVGDYLTSWGLPYPRGRDEIDAGQYDISGEIFSAPGSASLYRTAALQDVGLLDEDFFAYYEDVDLSFRLRLAGWKIGYEPRAKVYHAVGLTSGKMKGFTTLQTMKNQPLLLWKNLPLQLWPRVVPRFTLAYGLFMARAFQRGQGWYAIKGMVRAAVLECKKLPERHDIQRSKKISSQEVWSLIVKDLPPNAKALRTLRAKWWALQGKR
jgi:GT2 family glycosyltransferase